MTSGKATTAEKTKRRENRKATADWRPVAKAVELQSLCLTSLSCERVRNWSKPPGDDLYSVEISTSGHYVDDKDAEIFRVEITFHVGAHDPENEQIVVFKADVTYELLYRLKNIEQFSADQLREFSRINGTFTIWPYVREVLQSSTARMGLPPLTLPVHRIP